MMEKGKHALNHQALCVSVNELHTEKLKVGVVEAHFKRLPLCFEAACHHGLKMRIDSNVAGKLPELRLLGEAKVPRVQVKPSASPWRDGLLNGPTRCHNGLSHLLNG